MYFFDMEDYMTTCREKLNADNKAGGGGGGIIGCQRGVLMSDYEDLLTTGRATRDAFTLAINDWYTASTICLSGSCNPTLYNIYYDDYANNLRQYLIDSIIYFNNLKVGLIPRYYEYFILLGSPYAGTYEEYLQAQYNDNKFYTGTTSINIYVPDPTTSGFSAETVTIDYGNTLFNETTYYNYNNSIRNLMGSVKRLFKAIDNDNFEIFKI